MKRRTRDQGVAASAREPDKEASKLWRRRVTGRIGLAAAFVALAIAAVWLIRARHRAPETHDLELLRIAHLSQEAAYDSGLKLGRAGRHEESLPYYRRALAGGSEPTWAAHFNYAVSLYNVGFEVREVHGVAMPATRSSIERVALMRAALAQLDTAEMLATSPGDKATVLKGRGERFEIWGLPWDAFMQLRKAEWADPSQPALRQSSESYLMVLRHPDERWAPGTTRSGLPEPAAPALGDSSGR